MDTEVGARIAAARENYLRLLDEATDLLRNLDIYSAEVIGEAVERRQQLVDALQNYDAGIGEAPGAVGHGLSDFRIFQEEMTKKILEVDGLLIALVREKQIALKTKMSTASKSMTASQAYDTRGATSAGDLNDSV